ncbi:ABC transporter permease [Clostridium akagii]|uniref:ABC transporter permease n=1 Tax=Clostridium akagii TaxID=91623 RepID=UPI00047A25EA|nr:FtsX-like permease family protein [Clostridium akagii]
MIQSYKQLTGKYLKANKKRSVLTIIGIVLSVALIASIGFFLSGIQAAEVTQYKNEYGSWHVEFRNLNSNLATKVRSNPKVEKSGLLQFKPDINLGKGVVLTPKIASDSALELLPYKIKEGRLPNNKNEVVVEKWASKYIQKNIKIGDTIKLDNKKYKLVGLLEDSEQSQMQNKGILLSKSNDLPISGSTLLAEISSKTNLKNAVSELDSLADKKTVDNNSHVIDLEGGGSDSITKALFGTLAVVIAIVVIATIAVIYNSFQISVVERLKQFGLLRAVGMTPQQLRKMVLREATILAAIGIPIGLLLGIIAINAIKIAFKLIGADTVMPIEIAISPEVILISTVIGIASVYLSALVPSFFAGRISPLVAINSRTSITKEKIKRSKNRIIGKIFGFEGGLAAKNIKRNKKRYRITVFSIVISVVLFVTFKSFMDMTLNLNGSDNEGKKIQFSVVQNRSNSDENNENISNNIIDNISRLDTVNKVYRVYGDFPFKEYMDSSKEIEQVKAYPDLYKKEKLNGEEKTMFDGGRVSIYDDNSMEEAKKYVEAGKIDISKLNDENGVIVVNKNYVINEKTGKTYSGPITNLKVGDVIELKNLLDGNNRESSVKKVKVLAILKDDPFQSTYQNRGITIFTTEKVLKNLTGEAQIQPASLNIEIKDVKLEDKAQSEIQAAIQDNPALGTLNMIDGNRRIKSTILMVEILVYGFIIVVSLISSVNIINTLTTNIILRKREFAALKAIGLTQKGLKKMIVLEGLLYGIVGTIYGSIIASGLSYLMYRSIRGIQDFPWSVPWPAIAIAGGSAMIIGYLSVLSPLGRINKENIIEIIREDG